MPSSNNRGTAKVGFQFGLRSVFVLVTITAIVSAFAHYYGGAVVALLAACLVISIVSTLGPAVIVDVATKMLDRLKGKR